MIDILELRKAADSIMVAIENTFNTNSIELPARRYITLGGQGTVAYDCTQLTISWEQKYSGIPGNNFQTLNSCNGIMSGVFVVELVRNIPVSQQANIPPEPELIQEAAYGLMEDAVVLYEAGKAALLASDFENGLISVTAGAPAGALQSIIMSITMAV